MSIKFSFLLIVGLALLGFVFSTMSVIDTQRISTEQDSAFCVSKEGSCAGVYTSKYSEFMGIPLSNWGVMYFMFVVLVLLLGSKEWLTYENSKLLLYVIGGSGVLFSFYLISIMSFVLRTVCSNCMFSHTSNILMAVFLFRHLKKYDKIL